VDSDSHRRLRFDLLQSKLAVDPVPPATVQRILRHSSITVPTGTYVEVIEAVQRDALDSMGALFEQGGDESSGRLSSKKSRLSSNARKSGP
jgi:hypothetical protein